MATTEVILPKMGESVAEATITKWLKNIGDTIQEEEAIVEIATDKVDSEVPSPSSGILIEIKYKEGEVAKVGEIIAVIGDSFDKSNPTKTNAQHQPSIEQKTTKTIQNTQESSIKPIIQNQISDKFFSPLVKNIAKQEGIDFQELESISGSGKDGRVTKKDILEYIETKISVIPEVSEKKQESVSIIKPKDTAENLEPKKSYDSKSDLVEIIEMDRMRKLIADHMVKSKQTSPHVTSFVEADVTNLVQWREKIKAKFEKKEGEKITFTPIFVEAIVKALKDFPMVNISVEGSTIIRKKYINIGVATALPSGNLIVPVIKNADRLNLSGLTKSVNDIVNRARNNKLQPDEIQDGTFTLTNVGTFGNVMGTPIINQPQVAIMATGAIRKKPAVIETPSGDFIGIRHMMFLSLSYDHRVVDGSLGGSFLKRVSDYLENFDINREI